MDSVTPGNSASGRIEVVVPMKNESPSDSNSRSSLGNLTTGCSTPATSVGAAVTEPDTKVAIKTSARINAADRVKKLQSSALSLGASQGGRKRSAAALAEDTGASDVSLTHASKKRAVKRPMGTLSVQNDLETSDAALAHALQMEEYDYPRPTTEQGSLVDKFVDEHLEYDSDPDSRPVSFSPLSPEPPGLLHSGVASSDTSEDPLEDGLDDDLHDSEADLPPSWEEQRKARRVSRGFFSHVPSMTNHPLGRKRPKEPCVQASHSWYHVGCAQSTAYHPAKGSQATCLYNSQTQAIPTRGLELDDSSGKD